MKRNFIILLFIFLEIYLLSNSKIIIDDFVKTTNICLYNLMPTMFFSILFSTILIKLNFEEIIPKTFLNFLSKIFNINKKETIIFILSIISGYPNNAKMLNNNKNLDKLILYTNFINPIFLIGTVGGLYLKNIKLAIIIYLSQIISNIFLGIIIRNKKNYLADNENKKNYSIFRIYFSSLKDTIKSLVNIFSNILAFSILLTLLKHTLPFNKIINSFIIGIFEFSTGIYYISNLKISYFLKGLFILIIIIFSSFSVHMQMISINSKIKYNKLLLYKIINIIVGILVYLILSILI